MFQQGLSLQRSSLLIRLQWKKANMSLGKGSKPSATQQKHIKIANCSDLSWTTIWQTHLQTVLRMRRKYIARSENEACNDLE